MNLGQIMTTPVLTVRAADPASDALARMRDEGARHAVVLEGTRTIGVLSERDLGGPYAGALRAGRTVADFMKHQPVFGAPSMLAADAVRLMRERRIGCIPVLDGDDLVGIVTRSDLLDALAGRRHGGERRKADPLRPPPLVWPNRDNRS
jgi:acetoin utilization protein AcuB